jgi:RNA polymerase sigma factor (sigma-70 family)
MRKPQGSGSGVQTVIAAQQGDEQAMADLLAEYLPLIYNIVGRALNGHADADDVVQETMLRAVRCLTDLRDPAAFRSWLVAVTVRQLHDHRQERRAAPVPDLSPDLADPQADFVDRTILRLGLAGQRREVAEATRWLDDGDRELLALWWLETGGELDRADLAAALGLPPGHAAVRIARMKEQLTIARGVVRAVQPGAVCAGLLSITADWDRKPSPLWRKRIARHLRDCRECGAHCDGLIPAERLLAGLPLVPAVAAGADHGLPWRDDRVRSRIRRGRRTAGHSRHARPVARSPQARSVAKAASSLQLKLVAVTLAAACAVGGTVAVTYHHGARPAPAARPAAAVRPLTVVIARPAVLRHPQSARPAAIARKPAANAKKGVSAWTFSGVSKALAQSGASWYYTWSSGHAGITSPQGVRFVPMIWGPGSVTARTLSEVRREGRVLLTFNEPDMPSQSNMPVQQALQLWPRLMATGMRLGSPAVATGAATPGGWLDRFMRGAEARHYRVNFIAVHWYGAEFATGPAVS